MIPEKYYTSDATFAKREDLETPKDFEFLTTTCEKLDVDFLDSPWFLDIDLGEHHILLTYEKIYAALQIFQMRVFRLEIECACIISL